MPKSKVALIRCESYGQHDVDSAITIGIDLLGGLDKFVQNGEKIILKPNLLSAQPPHKAVTTHPNVFYAVAKHIRDEKSGLDLSWGDSSPKGTTKKILNTTGLKEKSDLLNLKFQDFEESITISNPKGIVHKQFTISRAVHECHGIINIAKLKTHHLTRITAAVKNIFGCIPGLLKPEFHLKLPGVFEFCQMIVELNLFIKPRLHIIDAIEAMEGNGPNAGTPKKLHCIIMSEDPVAADTVACKLIGLKPERVLTNLLGEKYNLGEMINFEIIGDGIESIIDKNFEVQRGVNLSSNVAWKFRFLKNLISLKPIVNKNKCKKCQECIKHCPAIPIGLYWNNIKGLPEYDYSNCKRCYCCQEICPAEAIEVKIPMIRKIMDRIFS